MAVPKVAGDPGPLPVWGFAARLLVTGIPDWYPRGHATEPAWDIPVIAAPRIDPLPTGATAFDKRQAADVWNIHGGLAATMLHFYVADHKLHPRILDPRSLASQLAPAWGIASPDISMWSDAPLDLRVLAVRVNRMLGAFYQSRGCNVVPTARWCTSRDWPFCFLGIEQRSAVSVSNHGLWRDRDLRQGFVSGLHEMIERIDPPVIFLHGTVSDRGIAAAGRKTHIVHFVDDRSRVRQAA